MPRNRPINPIHLHAVCLPATVEECRCFRSAGSPCFCYQHPALSPALLFFGQNSVFHHLLAAWYWHRCSTAEYLRGATAILPGHLPAGDLSAYRPGCCSDLHGRVAHIEPRAAVCSRIHSGLL